MENNKTVKIAISALEELKGNDIVLIDTRDKSDVFDAMVIVTGTSDRHVKSLADRLIVNAKEQGLDVLGVERDKAWVLIDLYDVIVHVMLEETRSFYGIEKLWQVSSEHKQIK